MNYKSGDLVKITGNCNYHHFTFGETVRLKENDGSDWLSESLEGRKRWWVRECDMTPVKPTAMPQKIIVTTDGKTTLARLFDGKTMVKRAESKCAPSDVFDFGVGAELAVKRLMGEKKPDILNPITEPVKLYCFKGIDSGLHLTKGKVYEFNGCGVTYDDGFCNKIKKSFEQWKNGNRKYANCLVPLVRRPAKVGEWVLVDRESEPKQVRRKCHAWDGCIVLADGRHSKGRSGFTYLVLDGYTGDPA